MFSFPPFFLQAGEKFTYRKPWPEALMFSKTHPRKNSATDIIIQFGCCFIKYATSKEANRAIRALYNQRTLPGGVGPIQVRYADGERECLGAVEHKFFVSSLNRQATEKEVEEEFGYSQLQVAAGSANDSTRFQQVWGSLYYFMQSGSLFDHCIVWPFSACAEGTSGFSGVDVEKQAFRKLMRKNLLGWIMLNNIRTR